MNKRHLSAAATVAVLIVAAYLFYRYVDTGHSAEKPQQPAAAQAGSSRELRYPPTAPQLNYIKIQQVESLPEPLLDPLNGRITYDENHTARVSTPITGRVVAIRAQPGDTVAAGQPLLEIDSPDYAQALADVNKTGADLRQKQTAYRRAKELVDAEVIARKDYEAAQADLAQSEAEYNRAIARFNNLTQGKGTRDQRFVLRAPISGIVSERKTNPGSEVRPDAQDPLFVITEPSHLWVIIDLPERLLGAVRPGQRVVVEVDAYPNERFAAKVASIGEVLDPATRRVQVRCVLDNPKRLLKPEMYARVTPLADGDTKLPRVPNSALITEGLYNFIFVEKEPGVFEKRRVTLGLQGRTESYVKQGLKEGERIVTVGPLLLNSELAGLN